MAILWRKLLCASLALLILLLIGPIASQPVQAQVTTGSISGTVSDPSGAVLTDAEVIIKDLGTNITRTVKTNANGLYIAPDLPVGQYQVTAQKAGFRTVTKTGIVLTVGAANVQNFTLAIGSQEQVLEVKAEVAQVETATSSLGALVDQRQMRELPLNGRNFEQLILLAPGVQPVSTGAQGSWYGRAQSYAIAGARPEGQALLLDGTDLQNMWGHGTGASVVGTSLGVEAIGEFQTLTNTYSAEFGGSGAVVNSASKSGTNHLHGSAYDFLRNSVFDARNYFDGPSGPPSFRRNQFGGSIGGPVRKDKTFFFANYEGLRQQLGRTGVTTVPDAAHHATACAVPSSVACQLISVWPLPNLPDVAGQPMGTGRYSAVANEPVNEDYVLGRIDQQLGPRDSLFGRFVYDRAEMVDPFPGRMYHGSIPGWAETDKARDAIFTIEEKRVLTPNLVNVARFSFTRMNQSAATPPTGKITTTFPGRQDAVISFLGMNNAYIGPNVVAPFSYPQNKFTPEDQVYWTHGAHDLRFGGYIRRVQTNFRGAFVPGGLWIFPGVDALAANAPALVLGPVPGGDDSRRFYRDTQYALYAQDNWKVGRNLTLNLGVRYQPMSNPVGDKSTIFNAVLDPKTSTGYTRVGHVFGDNPSLHNIDPRIGLAYSPFADNKTSIRAGFGMFHQLLEVRNYMGAYNLAPPFVMGVQIAPEFPHPFGGGICPGNIPFSAPNCYLYNPNVDEALFYRGASTPYLMQWNLNIQQQLSSGLVVSAGYVGSRGVHQLVMRDVNAPTAHQRADGRWIFDQAPFPGAPVPRPNPNFDYLEYNVTSGNSHYNALQLSATGQVTRGLNLQAFYTWSKNMDNGSNSTNAMTNNGSNLDSNPHDPRYDYGLSGFDMRHNFTANLLYDLPFKGSRWVEGYQISLISALHSGVPYSATVGFDTVGEGMPLVHIRPDQVGNPDIAGPVAANPNCAAPRSVHNAENWFNPCAFMLPGATVANPSGIPGLLGNERRNMLIGPAFMNFDFAVSKSTKISKISETFQIQFRAEFFNIFNHTNFALPVLDAFVDQAHPNARQATNITDTVHDSRQMQFGLKFLF